MELQKEYYYDPYVRTFFIKESEHLKRVNQGVEDFENLSINLFINFIKSIRTYVRTISTNVTTSIPQEIYNKAKEKNIQLSKALKQGILKLADEKEVVEVCDYCGASLENGNIRYIAITLGDYYVRLGGRKEKRRCVAVCNEEHKHVRDWEIFGRCLYGD